MQWMIKKTKVGGGFTKRPEDIAFISEEARKFIERNFEDIIPELAVYDHHCHIAGFGHEDTGCFLNTTMMTSKKAGNPVHQVKYFVFVSAALDHAGEEEVSLDQIADFDRRYVQRLARLVRCIPGPWGKQFLLALDCWYDPDGTRRPDKTGLYTPNDYVLKLAAEYPDIFAPAVSIHPYRPDAIQEIERCYNAGARMIKWLPNSMGIDPSHGKCLPFYDKMAELGMVLLSHTGKEHTVDGGELKQMYGNPLMLRSAMNRGVQVIAAHCSSRGDATDLDDPTGKTVPCLELFFRLMDDPKYEKLFFGDISALTSFKRVANALPQILNRTDVHHRLLNGSDYPLPAINVIVWTRKLVKKGLITKEERKWLKEIYHINPLLYDYLIKRTVKSKEGNRFPASVFMRNPQLKIYPEFSKDQRKLPSIVRNPFSMSHHRRGLVDSDEKEKNSESESEEEEEEKTKKGRHRRAMSHTHPHRHHLPLLHLSLPHHHHRRTRSHDGDLDKVARKVEKEKGKEKKRRREKNREKEKGKEKEKEREKGKEEEEEEKEKEKEKETEKEHLRVPPERKNKEGRNKAKFAKSPSFQTVD